MRLIIKPDDSDLNLLLTAGQYQTEWRQNSRRLRKAFREVTGLEFQQRVITARVFWDVQSDAGGFRRPMRLAAADLRSNEFKLATLVHELGHRLLGANGLGVYGLGLWQEGDDYDGDILDVDHRHLYLFTYDVMRAVLGEKGAEICRQYEERPAADEHDPHHDAWRWAMDLTFAQRQAALKWLAAKKVTREHWDDMPDSFDRVVAADWEALLDDAAHARDLSPSKVVQE